MPKSSGIKFGYQDCDQTSLSDWNINVQPSAEQNLEFWKDEKITEQQWALRMNTFPIWSLCLSPMGMHGVDSVNHHEKEGSLFFLISASRSPFVPTELGQIAPTKASTMLSRWYSLWTSHLLHQASAETIQIKSSDSAAWLDNISAFPWANPHVL